MVINNKKQYNYEKHNIMYLFGTWRYGAWFGGSACSCPKDGCRYA